MPPDTDMKIDYALVLKQLQDEIDGLDGRRQALLASIAAIRLLVPEDQQVHFAQDVDRGNGTESNGVRMPVIPPGFFSGKTPTVAYRDLMKVWPGYYRAPQIADLFMQGGMVVESRTALVQAIHSVLKRERKREGRLRLGG